MRITIGMPTRPRDRFRYLATWLITWFSEGYENASNCISTTGRQPAMARPTETPAIPDSARGVSNTRRSPNSSCSPSVTRNTPPSFPTSSPNTSVRSSSASDRRSASLSAFAMVTSGIALDLLELPCQVGRQVGVDPRERLPRRPRLEGQHALARPRGQRTRLTLDVVQERLVRDALRPERAQPPFQRVIAPPRLHVRLRLVPRG